MAFDDRGSAYVCTRTYSTLSTVHPRSHRSLHFPSVSSFSLFFSCAQVQNESARMSSTAASSISVISASCLSVRCVLSHSIISHVNHSPHLLSSLCQHSLLPNIHLHFSSNRWDCWGATRIYWIQICDQRVQVAK